MSVKGKSARGVMVDFDLLRIKEQMASAPAPFDVQARQDFVENKMRRRARKKVPDELVNTIKDQTTIDQDMPTVEDNVAAMIEEVVPVEVSDESVEKPAEKPAVGKKTQAKTKQKARPSKKTT